MRKITDNQRLMDEWHWEKNQELDPANIAEHSNKKFWWQCPKFPDHFWQASANSRVSQNSGCSCCHGRTIVLSNCLATLYPHIADKWHPILNGTLTPYDIAPNSQQSYWWYCDKAPDHVWNTRPNRMVFCNGGCPCCSGRRVVLSNCLATLFPRIASEWHPTLNGDLTPFNVAGKSGKKAWWICKNGHVWEVSVANRTSKDEGCRQCPHRTSKGEKYVLEVLTGMGIYNQREFRFTNCKNIMSLPFDFMVLPPDRDPGFIEYQGQQHYSALDQWGGEEALVKCRMRDQIKRDFCLSRNLPLLEIPYSSFLDIPHLVANFINSLPPRRTI